MVQIFGFDDRLGQREGEEMEKILAYYPPATTDDEKATAVGLVEGGGGTRRWSGLEWSELSWLGRATFQLYTTCARHAVHTTERGDLSSKRL